MISNLNNLVTNRALAGSILAVLVIALVIAAVALFLRGDDKAPIQVLVPPPTASSQALPGELKVYISGAVANPGVYSLREGDRLADAISIAGGANADADLSAVNLAVRVEDEEHYHIPAAGEAPSGGVAAALPGSSNPAGTCDGLIDLNTASATLLETLPGIGEVRAAATVSYRTEQGPFQSVEEITSVPGIGPATYESIRELVTVCNE